MVVIEMNPRVSRSSALASKATGFPIAKVAAKLAVGYTLDELENDITGGATPASFEPTIDYVVTKIPRFAFEKFPGAEPVLTTSMKSVGEAMAIGRTFAESLQKALRSLETGLTGLDEIEIEGLGKGDDKNAVKAALGTPTPDRLLKVAQALRLGFSKEEVYEMLPDRPLVPGAAPGDRRPRREGPRRTACPRRPAPSGSLKSMGFSDARLAVLAGRSEAEVKAQRRALGVRPVFKRIDTCAAEFASPTAYMYSTYAAPFAGAPADEAEPSEREEDRDPRRRAEPHRPGHRVRLLLLPCLLRAQGRRLRDDHDQLQPGDGVDRLRHLRPALFRAADGRGRARDRRHRARARHAARRHRAVRRPDAAEARPRRWRRRSVPILGTSPDAIDLAEDRDRFKRLLDKLGLKQPKNGIAYSVEQSRLIAADLGLPFVVRPSYVLGGRAMAIIRDEAQFEDYLLGTLPSLIPSDVKARYPNDKTGQINTVLGKNPLLFDRYLSDAIEIDVDALCDGRDVFIAGIMEHIEEAGIHSGDSACSLPPRSLSPETIAALERQTTALALALEVGGLMNVQYAIKDGDIYVLEVNPRASRTVPFVAKVIGEPIAKIAARVMAGESLASFGARRRRRCLTSPSRRRSSPSPASPASTCCSAPRCARPARSSASTAASASPSPRASSARARRCRAPARSSSRCAIRTRPASCRR